MASIQRVLNKAITEDRKARKSAKSAKSFDSFANFAAKLGLGQDNVTSGGSYGFNPVTRLRIQLEWIYRGSWIGGVAVDTVAEDMTRAGVSIQGNLEPDKIDQITELLTQLKAWKRVEQTIKWSRLYGGALGVFLIDGQDPATPLKLDRVGKDQFKGILVLDRWQVEPSFNDLITELGPDLGLPKYYKVGQAAVAYRNRKVHHSRVFRLTSVELPFNQSVQENLWGLSVYERLYDRLVAFDSATTGAAQLVYRAYIRTYSIDQMRSIAAGGGKALEGLVKYIEIMRRFQSIEGITLIDSKDKFEGHTHQAFGGLAEALVQFGQQLSGALQIPLVRLFGQSPAGLNSTGESDLRMYYDGILQHQESDLKIPITAIYRLAAQSLGIKVPKGFSIKFNPLWQLTDKERADITQVTETSIQSAFESGLIDKPTALRELKQSSNITGIFSNITDEAIKQAEEEPAPEPETADLPGEEKDEHDDEERPKPRKLSVDSASTFAWNHGLYVVVETPKGQLRRGRNWEAQMPADYGYIRSTRGADGDQVDCYLGPNPASEFVYIIDQMNPSGNFDEHKVMLGYDSQGDAEQDYVNSHSEGSQLMGAVTAMSMESFKDWLTTGNLSQPIGVLSHDRTSKA